MLGNAGPAPLRKRARHGWLMLIAVVALCASPTLAVAADKPTPEQQSDAYPLDPPANGPQLEVSASGAGTSAAASTTARDRDAGSGFPVGLAVGIGIVVFAVGMVLGSRRRRVPGRAPAPAGQSPRASVAATCEIRWRGGIVGPHFRAIMKVTGESGTQVIARSPKVDWPPILPPTPEPQVVEAARELARDLVAAGWRPEGHGPEWYAQRFAWSGARAPRSPEPKESVPSG
jgi:hypothetical protein